MILPLTARLRGALSPFGGRLRKDGSRTNSTGGGEEAGRPQVPPIDRRGQLFPPPLPLLLVGMFSSAPRPPAGSDPFLYAAPRCLLGLIFPLVVDPVLSFQEVDDDLDIPEVSPSACPGSSPRRCGGTGTKKIVHIRLHSTESDKGMEEGFFRDGLSPLRESDKEF